MKIYSGKTWHVGDDIDTDVIIAARYLNDASDAHLSAHCLEDAIPEFHKKIATGDILVAGKNFGCGSSREHAPIAIKATGISCVIAPSFARIFYRNAINIGLPIVTVKDDISDITPGSTIEVDVERGIVRNQDTGKEYQTEVFPPFIMEIIEAGNLLNYVKAKVEKNA